MKLFGDTAVAHANHVTSGKMHQAGVIALAQKVEQVNGGIDVGRERIAQIGIEIRQASAVHDDVERFCEACLGGFVEPKTRLADVSFDDFHFFFQKSPELTPVPVVKRVERGRFLDDFLEAPLGGRCAVAANQKGDLANVGNIFEQIDQPDFADESSHTDQQNM